MLDRVLRFFITLFLAIAGGALLDLASPVLTMYVGTEIFKMEMGVVRITVGSLLCILWGLFLAASSAILLRRTSSAVSNVFLRGWKHSWGKCQSMMSLPEPSALLSDSSSPICLAILLRRYRSSAIIFPSFSALFSVISVSRLPSASARSLRACLTLCRAL